MRENIICPATQLLRRGLNTTKKAKQFDTVSEDEVCFNDVINELKEGIARGMFFSLATVWQRYCEVLAEYDIEAPLYRSNRFKD